MAAAIVPLIVTLAPILAQLLPGIIRGVEALFSGPKEGPKKIEAAVSLAESAVTQIVNAGQIAGAPPTRDELRAMIEAVLATMQAGGEPKPPAGTAGSAAARLASGAPFTIERAWVIRSLDPPR